MTSSSITTTSLPSTATSTSLSDVVIIVPARLASTRLPNKPLSSVNDVPLVVRVLDTCSLIGVKSIVLATDHQSIKDTVEQYIQQSHPLLSDLSSVQVIMTSTEHNNGTERICEVIEKLNLPDDQLIVNIQGDEPFFDPQVIKLLVSDFITKEAQDQSIGMGTIGEPCPLTDIDNPNAVKVVTDNIGNAIYFSRSPIPYARTVKAAEVNYIKHAGVYCYRSGFVKKYKQLPNTPLATIESLEQLKIIESGYKISLVKITKHGFIGVDTAEDLAVASQVAAKYDQAMQQVLANNTNEAQASTTKDLSPAQALVQAKSTYLSHLGD